MCDVGEDLFRKVFDSNDDARALWYELRGNLNQTRIHVATEVKEATSVPWELLREPRGDLPLALSVPAFVRAPLSPIKHNLVTHHASRNTKIRILLVICRPKAGEDVPFRSVASRIVKSLSDEAREFVQLDVLRPPTFEQLGKVLRQAKARGEPYHVVHFDGHGLYADVGAKQFSLEVQARIASPLHYGAPRAGKHGYLIFENPESPENLMLVDGSSLGKLLVENDVATLVLNACQSAMAEAPTAPLAASESSEVGAQVRAFGSLAQEVMDTGVAGVVAMRYILYVETAKRFVADLYAALAQGQSLGQAVTFGRKQLATNPQREIAYQPIALQDWSVPIVYETMPIELFPRVGAFEKTPTGSSIRAFFQTPLQITRAMEIGLPPRPDVGFFGRDETLYALDRAFDTQQIVLLHAFAGSGKTTTAAEFARWYALTGGVTLSGVEGAALFFTSFEHRKTLTEALNETIGRAFNDALEQSGVHWLALTDEHRRAVALQVMQQVPMLWIWDNVEPIAGFPTGTESKWNEREQRELKEFLAAARETKAKFLLTSRRDEREWLGDLPRRIIVPPMPMQERVQLARALAEKFAHRFFEVEDWRPLLEFTQGNPLTITVVVGEALRKGIKTRLEIRDFVERLRKGESAFEDEQSEARSKSLGASLSYGFENAFTETERKQLALLHFFQGFVDVDALRAMGNPEADYCLPEVRGLTREAGIALLDRAAEIGLLTAHGGGYYSIHPALPWYFRSLFEQYYPTPTPTLPRSEKHRTGEGESGLPSPVGAVPMGEGTGMGVAARAFVEAMGELGNYYAAEYAHGNRDVIGALTAEEANLLHARRMAKESGNWRGVISTMQGLRQLYGHTGRRVEWARLVNEIVPDFVDPATDGPRAGREEQWHFVMQYRTQLSREARQWQEAERLQIAQVNVLRQRAAPALAVPPNALDDAQRNAIRTLAVSLEVMGNIQREQSKPECAKTYQEAIPLCQRIGDKPEEAIIAFNLGHAYLTLPALRDLAQAERWYRRSLELHDARDSLGCGKCTITLGNVAYERFKEARDADVRAKHYFRLPTNENNASPLQDAVKFYQQALDLLPPNAVNDLAVAHNQLGVIYKNAGDLDRALPHYREAIRYTEATGNLYQAGQIRFNVALALANAGRLADAREYALAALRNYETFGDRAAEEIERTRRLVAQLS